MQRHPTVVACVPAWNAAAFIERTLDSLAAQTCGDLRVLISVDLSTDATAEICESYAARDGRFEVLRQQRRLGWIGNTNELLRHVEAKYCFFALHDDVLEPTFVSDLVAALEVNPRSVVAFSDMDTTYLDGQVKIGAYDLLDGVHDPVERTLRILGRRGDWWTPHRGIFRVDIGKRIGGLRKHLAGEFRADWPWLVHLSLYGEFVRVPKVLCHKHYMKESLSLGWKRTRWQNAALNISCIREILRAKVPIRLKCAVLLPKLLERLRRYAPFSRTSNINGPSL
jgi:glycosyltransferase involved in cell wall biosynthesis